MRISSQNIKRNKTNTANNSCMEVRLISEFFIVEFLATWAPWMGKILAGLDG